MVEVRVRHQHGIDGRQVAQPQAGTTQPLEDEEPACKIGIDDDVLAADLQEEAGVSDEGNTQLAARASTGLRVSRCAASMRSGAPACRTAWPCVECDA